jgi:hypothetical protein
LFSGVSGMLPGTRLLHDLPPYHPHLKAIHKGHFVFVSSVVHLEASLKIKDNDKVGMVVNDRV